jgi:hypothetical protein
LQLGQQVLLPLSHYYPFPRIPSPQTLAKQLEGALILPIQVKPVNIKQFEQPVAFPLPHSYSSALMLSPHIVMHDDALPIAPVQL